MAKIMLTLKLDPSEATPKDVRRKLGLKKADLDDEFGVIAIRPSEHLYTVLVDEEAARRVSDESWVSGSYSNPKIEPLGQN